MAFHRVCPGAPSFQHLHLWPANHRLQKVCICWRQWCAQVIFFESVSQAFESQSSQTHLKSFRVVSEMSRDLLDSSQSGVTRTVESLRVFGLQSWVKKNFTFFLCVFFARLWTGAQHTIKWISKFLWKQFAFYLPLPLSVISTSLAQPCCKCFNLLVGVTLNVRFTTNGICMKNNNRYRYAWRTTPVYRLHGANKQW